jgi:hypothetical protein
MRRHFLLPDLAEEDEVVVASKPSHGCRPNTSWPSSLGSKPAGNR